MRCYNIDIIMNVYTNRSSDGRFSFCPYNVLSTYGDFWIGAWGRLWSLTVLQQKTEKKLLQYLKIYVGREMGLASPP